MRGALLAYAEEGGTLLAYAGEGSALLAYAGEGRARYTITFAWVAWFAISKY